MAGSSPVSHHSCALEPDIATGLHAIYCYTHQPTVTVYCHAEDGTLHIQLCKAEKVCSHSVQVAPCCHHQHMHLTHDVLTMARPRRATPQCARHGTDVIVTPGAGRGLGLSAGRARAWWRRAGGGGQAPHAGALPGRGEGSNIGVLHREVPVVLDIQSGRGCGPAIWNSQEMEEQLIAGTRSVQPWR